MFGSADRARLAATCILLLFVFANLILYRSPTLHRWPQYSFGIEGTNSERRAWLVLVIILSYSWMARLLIVDFSWKTLVDDPLNWILLGVEALLLGFAGFWLLPKALNTQWRPNAVTALVSSTVVLQIAYHWLSPGVFASRAFYFYRSEHLLDGVCPVLPFIFLLCALIALISRHVQALFVFSDALVPCIPEPPEQKDGDICVQLPRNEGAKMVFRVCVSPWRLIEESMTWKERIALLLGAILAGWISRLVFGGWFDTLESPAYAVCITLFAAFVVLMLLHELFWCLLMWANLKKIFLAPLERSPLRICFSRIAGFSWRHLWMNLDFDPSQELRYKPLSRAHESVCQIERNWWCPSRVGRWARVADRRYCRMLNFIRVSEDTKNPAKSIQRFKSYKTSLCCLATEVIGSILLPGACQERLSTSLDVAAPERAKVLEESANAFPLRASAEEFVGLIYIHVIQRVLANIRSHVFPFAFGYVFLLLALDTYPVGPHHSIMMLLIILFVLFLVAIVWIFQQMNRDSILSRTTDTEPGMLDRSFWLHLGSALGVPLLGLIASQFPAMSNFLYSWLQPSLQAIK